MTAGCWVATAGRTSRLCQNPDTGCRCTEWRRVPSPHWHMPPPGHLVPLEQVPVTHHTRPPACKTQPSAEAFGLASQLPLPPPHLPFTSSHLSAAQDQAGGTWQRQHAAVVQTPFTYMMERESLGSCRTNRDVQNKWCALRQIVTLPTRDKEGCRGKAQPGNQSLRLVCSEQTVEEE